MDALRKAGEGGGGGTVCLASPLENRNGPIDSGEGEGF